MKALPLRTGSAPDLLPSVLVIGALYVARELLIPVALAVLLTFLLTPLVTRVQRLVRSRALAVACVTAAAVGVAGAGVFGLGHQFVSLAAQLPEYHDTLSRKVRSIREGTKGVVSDAAQSLRAIGAELTNKPGAEPSSTPALPVTTHGGDAAPATGASVPPSAAQPAASSPADSVATLVGMLRPLVPPVATGLVVVLLLAMMLNSREAIRDRIIRLAGLRQMSLTTQTMEETAARVGGYLRAQSLINVIYGTIVYLGLLLMGVPNAAVCGVIAGVLRFVPILGIWLGAALPAALAIAVFDDWGHLGLVVSLFVALELIANFVLEPWLYGASTGISTIGVVAAIVFWTWIWGGVGLVLAMPITVCVMVFARQFPRLAVVPILFGDEPVLSESARFYQRLLGGSQDDAAAVLRTPRPSVPIPDAVPGTMIARLDSVVVPALGTARQELIKGAISDVQAVRVAQGVRDVTLDWIGEQPVEAPVAAEAAPAHDAVRPRISCLPVNDEADECAAAILAACLEARGLIVTSPPADARLSEMLHQAAESRAEVVILSAIAPSSALNTRRACRAVRRAMPAVKLVVCAWNGVRSSEASLELPSGADAEATTLGEAIEAVAHLLTPLGEPVASGR